MVRLLKSAGRFAGSLRWLFMPLGLFATVAVGVHVGADAVDDWLLSAFDWIDGRCDRALAALLLATGDLFNVEASRVDGWVFRAASVVDLRERALLARWGAVALELGLDAGLALPALAYREREKASTELEDRARQVLAERGFAWTRCEDIRELLRAAIRDPTLLRLLLPPITALVAIAAASRIASEVQAVAFSSLAAISSTALAGAVARVAAIAALGGVLVSLGGRATLQALCWAHSRAEAAQREGRSSLSRRSAGLLRIAFGLPVACAALAAAPLLSFFR